MTITEVIVSAGRTFNDPYESYSNHKPHVTLKATLGDGDDAAVVVKELQAKAEGLAEDHKQLMLSQIRDRHNLNERQREVRSLEQNIVAAQERLSQIRDSIAKGLPAPEEDIVVPEIMDDDDDDRRSRRY